MKLEIPKLCLVTLVGPSGSGKSSFARKHFLPTEVVSSDACRGMVCDNENSLEHSREAFALVHYIARQRLELGKLVVIDATNVQEEARRPILELARDQDVLAVAIVLNVDDETCLKRNKSRPDRQFGDHVVRLHGRQMRRSIRYLKNEGFRHVFVLSPADIDAAVIERVPLWNDKTDLRGPFDIIGDVHGCFEEMAELLAKLGYQIAREGGGFQVTPPPGRTAIFLGDLCDRGPNTPDVYRLVMSMVAAGSALCVPGNHDAKLLKALRGRDVKLTHGLDKTLAQLNAVSELGLKSKIADFIDRLVSHYVLDDRKLVVSHAGIKAQYIGRSSGRVRDFCLYGETTGESDDAGLPIRLDWASDYRGKPSIAYGHTPVAEAEWLNGTINLDTGCVFGGKLTALRWPERELISVAAKDLYAEPGRGFLPIHEVPAFGTREEGREYNERPGAYLIAMDEGRVACVQTPMGLLLPGGGIDAGETPRETAARETLEETGRAARVDSFIGRAFQTVIDSQQMGYNKNCHYFRGELLPGEWAGQEADHVPVWVPIDEAVERLSLESDRWALRRATGRQEPVVRQTLQQRHDDLLDLDDVIGKRVVDTRLMSRVSVREANATAALEIMSRFAIDPRWLVYLPPTMSPCATSDVDGYLERPEQALSYFRDMGVQEVVCQEKHMGSRAVVVACRTGDVGIKRFGVEGEGIVYTRTGRRFFDDLSVESAVLNEVRLAAERSGIWDELETDYLVLDCELMPWSAKAMELLRRQYAPVGAASRASLAAAISVLAEAVGTDVLLSDARESLARRAEAAEKYTQAYGRYCWRVDSPADLKLAPFHLLASGQRAHTDRDHRWHMAMAHRLAEAGSGILLKTEFVTARLDDVAACGQVATWWEQKTATGGEGMVVKPLGFSERSEKGLVQPAVKCRGKEYLRIIYGPEYDLPGNLNRLRNRGLNGKRSLALREFALGVEALERFVRGEPLRRVHECVFAVLAMESEPVDPRL